MRLQGRCADVERIVTGLGNHVVRNSAADHRHITVRPAKLRMTGAPVECLQAHHVFGRNDHRILGRLRGRVARMSPSAPGPSLQYQQTALVRHRRQTRRFADHRGVQRPEPSRISARPSLAVSSRSSASTIVPPSLSPCFRRRAPPRTASIMRRHAPLGVVGAQPDQAGRLRRRGIHGSPVHPSPGGTVSRCEFRAAAGGRRRRSPTRCYSPRGGPPVPPRPTARQSGRPAGFLARDAATRRRTGPAVRSWVHPLPLWQSRRLVDRGRARPRSSCRSPRW